MSTFCLIAVTILLTKVEIPVPPLSSLFFSSFLLSGIELSFFLFDSISLLINIFNILEAVSEISDSLSLTNFLINSFNDFGMLFKRTVLSLSIFSYKKFKIFMR